MLVKLPFGDGRMVLTIARVHEPRCGQVAIDGEATGCSRAEASGFSDKQGKNVVLVRNFYHTLGQ